DDGLGSESFDERDLLAGERLDYELVEDDDAEDLVAAKHGHPKFGVDLIDVSQRVAVFGIRLEVSDVNRPSLECDSGGDRMSPWGYGVAPDVIDRLRRRVVEGDPMIGVTIPSEDDSPRRLAQPRCVLDQCIEYWLEIEVRAADDAQDLRCRSLLLQRCGEIAIADLQLFE